MRYEMCQSGLERSLLLPLSFLIFPLLQVTSYMLQEILILAFFTLSFILFTFSFVAGYRLQVTGYRKSGLERSSLYPLSFILFPYFRLSGWQQEFSTAFATLAVSALICMEGDSFSFGGLR